jgi:hypothetical protein
MQPAPDLSKEYEAPHPVKDFGVVIKSSETPRWGDPCCIAGVLSRCRVCLQFIYPSSTVFLHASVTRVVFLVIFPLSQRNHPGTLDEW